MSVSIIKSRITLFYKGLLQLLSVHYYYFFYFFISLHVYTLLLYFIYPCEIKILLLIIIKLLLLLLNMMINFKLSSLIMKTFRTHAIYLAIYSYLNNYLRHKIHTF